MGPFGDEVGYERDGYLEIAKIVRGCEHRMGSGVYRMYDITIECAASAHIRRTL